MYNVQLYNVQSPQQVHLKRPVLSGDLRAVTKTPHMITSKITKSLYIQWIGAQVLPSQPSTTKTTYDVVISVTFCLI